MKSIELRFILKSDVMGHLGENEKEVTEFMEDIIGRLDEVIELLEKDKILANSGTEFVWTVGDADSMTADLNSVMGIAEVDSAQVEAIDKLVRETTLAVRSPLLKFDAKTQGLYNGIERVIAILDGREPDTVDSYGVLDSEKGEKK